jgi:hypothetical protein
MIGVIRLRFVFLLSIHANAADGTIVDQEATHGAEPASTQAKVAARDALSAPRLLGRTGTLLPRAKPGMDEPRPAPPCYLPGSA